MSRGGFDAGSSDITKPAGRRRGRGRSALACLARLRTGARAAGVDAAQDRAAVRLAVGRASVGPAARLRPRAVHHPAVQGRPVSAFMRRVAAVRCGSPAEWAVLMCIAVHCGEDDGLAWPSVGRIATQTGLSRKHVSSMIGRLLARGVLRREPVPERLPGMRKIRTRAYSVRLEPGSSGA